MNIFVNKGYINYSILLVRCLLLHFTSLLIQILHYEVLNQRAVLNGTLYFIFEIFIAKWYVHLHLN